MIALLKACLFFNPCARTELHQQKRARKLCSATLSEIILAAIYKITFDISNYIFYFLPRNVSSSKSSV